MEDPLICHEDMPEDILICHEDMPALNSTQTLEDEKGKKRPSQFSSTGPSPIVSTALSYASQELLPRYYGAQLMNTNSDLPSYATNQKQQTSRTLGSPTHKELSTSQKQRDHLGNNITGGIKAPPSMPHSQNNKESRVDEPGLTSMEYQHQSESSQRTKRPKIGDIKKPRKRTESVPIVGISDHAERLHQPEDNKNHEGIEVDASEAFREKPTDSTGKRKAVSRQHTRKQRPRAVPVELLCGKKWSSPSLSKLAYDWSKLGFGDTTGTPAMNQALQHRDLPTMSPIELLGMLQREHIKLSTILPPSNHPLAESVRHGHLRRFGRSVRQELIVENDDDGKHQDNKGQLLQELWTMGSDLFRALLLEDADGGDLYHKEYAYLTADQVKDRMVLFEQRAADMKSKEARLKKATDSLMLELQVDRNALGEKELSSVGDVHAAKDTASFPQIGAEAAWKKGLDQLLGEGRDTFLVDHDRYE